MGRRRRSKFHNRLEQERIEGIATLFPDEQVNRYREETPNDIAMKERQEMVARDVSKIKEAVYNPDQGLYARIRQLEAWKSTSTKLIWTLFTAMTGLMSAIVLKYLP